MFSFQCAFGKSVSVQFIYKMLQYLLYCFEISINIKNLFLRLYTQMSLKTQRRQREVMADLCDGIVVSGSTSYLTLEWISMNTFSSHLQDNYLSLLVLSTGRTDSSACTCYLTLSAARNSRYVISYCPYVSCNPRWVII